MAKSFQAIPGTLASSVQDSDDDYDDEEDVYLLHNLAEKGQIDRLRALLPLPFECSNPPLRQSVLSSETSLLEKDDMGFLPLHIAVLHQQTACALHLLRYSSALTSAMLRLKGGDFGTPLLHLILRVGAINASCSKELIHELLTERTQDSGVFHDDMRALMLEKVAAKDEEGNTVFHLCARYDLVACMDELALFYRKQCAVVNGASLEREKKKRPLTLEKLLEKGNKIGFRPLHEAMKYQAAAAVKKLIHEYNVDVNSVTTLRQTPAHIAALVGFADGIDLLHASSRHVRADLTRQDMQGFTAAQVANHCGFIALEKRLVAAEAVKSIPKEPCEMDQIYLNNQTRLYFHPEVYRHLPMAYHYRGGPDPPPENPERIDTLVDPVFGVLRSREFQRPNVKWHDKIERADLADILRVHEFHYVDRLRRTCAGLAASIGGKKPVEFKNVGLRSIQRLDPLKSMSCSSLEDSEECCATHSLDSDTALSVGSYEAATRAAGAVCQAVDDVVAGKCRNAFCIVRPPGHHAGPVGKVVCKNDREGSLGFCLFNNVAVGAAFARAHYKHEGIHKVAIVDFDVHHGNGTEEIVRQLVPSMKEIDYETPYGTGKQVVHQYKPWRNDNDAENVFFSSVHGYGQKDQDDMVHQETPSWFYPGSGESRVKEFPVIWNEGLGLDCQGSSVSRLKWRSAFRDRILPKLCEFHPDLIFLSAGFDAHKKELVNWGYLALLEQDYEWLVDHIKRVANTCCHGRLISVLEGGYNFHGRMISPFARSVAAHTRALINPARKLWDKDEIAKEAAHEQALLAHYQEPTATNVTILQTKRSTLNTAEMTRKRPRKEVDYVLLAKELAEQRQESLD
ncbi:hypothetical protein CCR75_008342 [Bremia lactucae]|uniref:Histone deacetylase domain-containing protein n=1 Tax=Bremia lactucae TaxID=4779 RepID=A0A976IFF7_BRELC|nr:hypothetical protein CCR75_008342 [Bremia lactucae]